MAKGSLRLAGWLMAAVAAGALAPGAARAQQEAKSALDVTRVEFGGETPRQAIALVAPGKWDELRSNGEAAFHFEETGRDAARIELIDRSRNFRLVIDMAERTVWWPTERGEKAELGKITAAYNTGRAAAAATTGTPSATASTIASPGASTAAAADEPNPFAEPTATTTPTRVNTPPWVQKQASAAAGTDAAAAADAPDPALSPYRGPWIMANKAVERRGDGITGPVTWEQPGVAYVVAPTPDDLIVMFDDLPGTSLALKKKSETLFTEPDHTASFTKVGEDGWLMRVSGMKIGQRQYSIARTGEKNVLARDRDKPQRADKASRYDGWTAGMMAKNWTTLFTGRDGPAMNLFRPGAGTKGEVFEEPGAKDYATNDRMSKLLPFGLRGEPLNESSSQQMETLISNAAAFQKSMSYNFGGSGGDPSKASLGINVSREQSSGTETNDGKMRAIGIGTAQNYVLYLDKANLALADQFKTMVAELAAGSMSPAQFRSNFGTHYANAIVFGGIGKAEKEMTSRELKDFASSSTSVSASGGAKGVSLTGGFSLKEGRSAGTSSMFSRSDWSAIGGAGTMGAEGWSVNENDAVPVRYDLRPLSDLVSPIFFPAEFGGPKRASYLQARKALETEINRYMASQPPLSNQPLGPAIYRLTFHALKCMNNGDEGTKPAEIIGAINATIEGTDGVQNVTLYSADKATRKEISCNGGAELPINQTVLVAGARSGRGANFLISAPGVEEYDPVDPNDPLYASGTVVKLRDNAASSPRIDLPGTQITNAAGVKYGPDLRVRVSWEELR